MNRKDVEKWLNNLKKYWLEKDVEQAVNLFKKTTFYQETPFMSAYTSTQEITAEWQHITEEDIQSLDFKILAIDGSTAIVEWLLEQNGTQYDGVYEIKFNENSECVYFKSWEMSQEYS